jgi:hypothetical protein
MGRLGPLIPQALGRSPYDDVVDGEGEPDPHEPEKQYDEKGRIINPRTKKVIRDVIRAHNEVMAVIGVAEPEALALDEAQATLKEEHRLYEADTGKTLLNVGRTLGILGIWGVHGARQRILLYREYTAVPFSQLWQFERSRHSILQLCLAGIPAFIGMQGVRWCSMAIKDVKENAWLRSILAYLRFHLHLFLTMQRLNLIPSSQWLPGISFFIPFSETSPFSAPPPLTSFSAGNITEWLGKLAVNVAPYVAFYLCGRVWNAVHMWTWPHILRRLPKPSVRSGPLLGHSLTLQAQRTWQPVPESPTLGAADREIRHTSNPDADIPTLMALDGQPPPDAIPVEAIRRQSTFSSRGGEEYGTDEEDADMVNPTLISFDVDTSDSNEPPPGVWSAELRPSTGGDGRAHIREDPIYIVNPLTKLPSILGADILTNFLAYHACAPFDALVIRAVGRAFAQKKGLPFHHMFEVDLFSSISLRSVSHIVGIEMLRLLISGEVWAVITVISQWLHVTDEEWEDIHKEEATQGVPSDAQS